MRIFSRAEFHEKAKEVSATSLIRLLIPILSAFALSGCADAPAIQPAAASKSKFESSVYHGETVTVRSTPEGVTEYRVFQEGSTGFVSIQSVRSDAEQRATDFCAQTDKVMLSLRETTAIPPYILGNFPRVEIVFGCIEKLAVTSTTPVNDPKYVKLIDLKKLLDSKVITQQEFDAEKAKILAEP